MRNEDQFDSDTLMYERSAVASVLSGKIPLDDMRGINPSDFMDRDLSVVFVAVREMLTSGIPVTQKTIEVELRGREVLDKLGGADHITLMIYEGNVQYRDYAYYAQKVLDASGRRRLRQAAIEAVSLASNPHVKIEDIAQHLLTSCGHIQHTDDDDWTAIDYTELRGNKDRPDRGDDYIDGLLRKSEVMLIGSSSKSGKSWIVGNLIWAAASGSLWLGRQVKKGRVLLIDNELRKCEIDWRHDQIAYAMQYTQAPGELEIIPKRGKACNIDAIDLHLGRSKHKWDEYAFIIIDALYKTIPDGKSENDNEAMGKLMQHLQCIAETTGVPVIGVHHATKGNQSAKAVLDVFSGAGSFGRALDSAVVIRDHETEGLYVIDYATRTHPPIEPESATFDFPLWTLVTSAPSLKSDKPRDRDLAERDKESDDALLKLLQKKPKQWRTATNIRREIGIGGTRADRAIGRAIASDLITSGKKTVHGKKTDVYRLTNPNANGTEDGTEDGTNQPAYQTAANGTANGTAKRRAVT